VTVTVADLANRLGMTGEITDPVVLADLTRVLGVAVGLLEGRIIVPGGDRTPEQIQTVDETTLQVAVDGWRRRDAPGGVYQMGDGSDSPAHLSADPLKSVWPTLRQAKLVRLAIGKRPPPTSEAVVIR
jgi:hypothetical protein